MSSKIRKYDSGCEKHKKKKKDEQLAQSLKGALDQYFKKGQANEVTNGDQKVDNDNQNTNDLNQNADNDNQNMNYDSQSMKDHNQNVIFYSLLKSLIVFQMQLSHIEFY